jgi:hypothetical protein
MTFVLMTSRPVTTRDSNLFGQALHGGSSGRTQTLNLGMRRQVVYHSATATVLLHA